jgi:fructose-1,6-bisphosphatase/sedoheptulose 1,7-bisphosphatase-like protein
MTAEEFADYEWSRRNYYDWESTQYYLEKAKEEAKRAEENAKKAKEEAKRAEERSIQMVRNLKELKVSMDIIKQATGLTEEEINAL